MIFSQKQTEKKVIRNCRFYSDGTYYHRAYGAGFRSGDDFIFENCIFEQTDTSFAPVSFHNNINFTKPATIKFKNCRFIGGSYGAQFGSLTTNAVGINTLVFEGCSAYNNSVSAIRLFEESASNYGKGCMFRVTGYGNTFSNEGVLIQTTDSIDYSSRLDLLYVDKSTIISLIDGKTKNLINVYNSPHGQTATINDVTWSVQSDGTVTANGTASANSFFYITASNLNVVLSSDETIMTGCPSGGSNTTYEIQTSKFGGSIHSDYGNGVVQEGGYAYRYVVLVVRNGYTANNLVFSPMVCTTDMYKLSNKFVSYCPTMSEMWQTIRQIQAT